MELTGPQFEQQVRSIARAIWPVPPGAGGASVVEGQERDCIFELEDVTHYIEVTMLNTIDKVKHDLQKMVRYRDAEFKKGRLVKLWIVTLHEPTAQQRDLCRQQSVEIMTLSEFRRRIIDVPRYLEVRSHYPFGSATDPSNDTEDLSNVKYLPIKLLNEDSGTLLTTSDVATLLTQPQAVVIVGDYGMGKSLNIREIFLQLRAWHWRNQAETPLPVVLNLRDHWGQEEPSEALLRHATRIGFDKPNELVRAFNAGRLAVLLDGFDEISGTPWSRVSELRTLRRNSVKLIANFVSRARGKCSILIAGREHFFDSRNEMIEAFELHSGFTLLSLSEFTDNEASKYLEAQGLSGTLPTWFPKRPLLLASLAARGLIREVLDTDQNLAPAVAWDLLLGLICRREATIQKYLDASGIRRILELLATNTRVSPTNLGPVTEDNLAEAFRTIVGSYPDEVARPLLLRLPGLSGRNQQDGSRSFMDDQLLDVLRAGTLVRFVENPWANPNGESWQHGIGPLGAQVAAEKIVNLAKSDTMVYVAAKQAIEKWNSPTLALDLVAVAQYTSSDQVRIDFSISVSGGCAAVLNLVDLPSPRCMILNSCIISELLLPIESIQEISLQNCIIEKVVGASNQSMLPKWIEDCEIQKFDEELTNAVIMDESKQPVSVRVLLTILRKLYLQGGGGRRENALYRGLDPKAHRYVAQVLELLEGEGMISCSRIRGYKVWYTVSGQNRRVAEIITSVGRSSEPIVTNVRRLMLSN